MKNTLTLPYERLVLAGLSVAALLGSVMIGYTVVDSWNSLTTHERSGMISVHDARSTAEEFFRTQLQGDPSAFDSAISIAETASGPTFLDRSHLSDDELVAYRDRFELSETGYVVRFFRELEIEEYSIVVDAFDNSVVSFMHIQPEDVVRTESTQDTARTRAQEFLVSRGFAAESLTPLDVQELTLPGGVDYFVTFKRTGSEVASDFGEGYQRVTVSLAGDQVSGYYMDMFVPENFERDMAKRSSVGSLLGLCSLLAWVVMVLIALGVMIRAFIAGAAHFKLALGITIVLAALSVIDMFNNFATLKANYSTDIAFGVYLVTALIIALVFILLSLSVFFIPAVAGISRGLVEYRDRFEPLTSLPRKGDSLREYHLALLRGYLIGIGMLGLTYAIYWVGETYLGVWSILEGAAADPTLVAYVPAFSYVLSFGLIAAITEEILFRLFGILIFRSLLRSTILAVLVATLIWAFAHNDGTTFPYWFRGVEVLIGGLLFSYFFIRYNVLTTIIAHYVHNILIAGTIMIVMLGFSQVPVVAVMILLPLLALYVTYGVTLWRGADTAVSASHEAI